MKNSLKEIQILVDGQYSKICDFKDGSFGQWIGLYVWAPELGYEEEMEASLYLLKRLLDENKVFFLVPNKMLSDGIATPTRVCGEYDSVWDLPHAEIIQYIRDNWPEAEHNFGREDVPSAFWYDGVCPWIVWVHPETGELVAS